MTREICREVKDGVVCRLKKGHGGDHKAWSKNKDKPVVTWPSESGLQSVDEVMSDVGSGLAE